MAAMMTFTACLEDDNEGGENGNGGGVAGKRLKYYIVSSPGTVDIKTEYTYNSDGTDKRNDVTQGGKLILYELYTSNPDGLLAKHEQYMPDMPGYKNVWEYTYDSNKKMKKRDGVMYMDGKITGTSTVDYTFQNGRKIKEVVTDNYGGGSQVMILEYSYDSKGKRTITNQTINGVPSQSTRIYNSDGTLQKVTHSSGSVYTFTWENGKSISDFDDHAQF